MIKKNQSNSLLQSNGDFQGSSKIKLDSSRIFLDKDKTVEDYEDLICSICQDVSLDIQECEECEHVFCQPCINDWLMKKNECPYKCKNWKLKRPHKIVRNSLNNLQFSCINFDKGCKVKVSLNTSETHETQDCDYKTIQCKQPGCSQQFFQKDQQSHKLSCQFKPYICPQCDLEMPQTQKNSHNCLKHMQQKIQELNQKMSQMITKEEMEKILQNYVPRKQFEKFQFETEQKIANIFDKITIQENNNQEKNFCPEGHRLELVQKNTFTWNSLVCDHCEQRLKALNVKSHRCFQCDFDRCDICYQNNILD